MSPCLHIGCVPPRENLYTIHEKFMLEFFLYFCIFWQKLPTIIEHLHINITQGSEENLQITEVAIQSLPLNIKPV